MKVVVANKHLQRRQNILKIGIFYEIREHFFPKDFLGRKNKLRT
jgi:hypothetical protein